MFWNKDNQNSAAGYTLVEMVVVIALSGLLALGAMSLFSRFSDTTDRFDSLISGELETVAAERQLLNDFKRAFPSFNTIEIEDVNGNNFFDLFFDTPQALLRDKRRTFVLGTDSDKGHKREIVILISLDRPALYDPVRAYNVTPPSTFGQAGGIDFVGVNKGNYINRASGGLHPGLWQVGALFYLYCPVSVRPNSVTGAIDFSQPARWSVFLGRVDARRKLVKEPLVVGGSATVRDEHPANPSFIIDSADKFLRSIPASGGGTPHVFIMPVAAIKYSLEEQTRANGSKFNRLIRRLFINGSFQNAGQEVVREFETVTFSRGSVTVPSVSVDVYRGSGS